MGQLSWISTEDGLDLPIKIYDSLSPKALVIIAPAMGVKLRYYHKFSEHLSTQGYLTILFNYRGIEQSKPDQKKNFKPYLHQWGVFDLSAVIRYAKNNANGAPVYLVAHSVGGQMFGLAPNNHKVDKAFFIGSQSGYWGHWDGFNRMKVFVFWHFLIPSFSKLFGYFPAKSFGLFEDLPGGVAEEWAKWGRSKDYLFGHIYMAKESFSKFRSQIIAYSFEDDFFAPKKAVQALLTSYANAEIYHYHYKPSELNIPSVGHFAFFKEKHKDIFWNRLINEFSYHST